ncbi:hypothetical protein FKN04_12550 [Bacillus glycinifermentans]|uniref:hypothetical protein n=1 Tax=Bacillus glycinifermentans TaxID=1664069 RepID=UPI001583BF3B|nr:hypothetical protein [Bacillus glycinifermentans]NUJ17405.1 hypothetical protein [Bacillus glycinifermentans]
MKKIFCFLLILSLSAFGFYPSVSSASEKSQQEVKEAKQYVQKHVPILKNEFKKLSRSSSLEDIESLIEKHFKEYPAPQSLKSNKISVFDAFPEKQHKYEKFSGKSLNLNNLLNDIKTSSTGDVFTFESKDNTVKVLLGEFGDINILEQKSISNPSVSKAKTTKATGIQRQTGIGYGTYGTKLYTLWCEGNFSYNGKTVKVISKDGDYHKHPSGSILTLDPRGLGKERDASIGKYKYKEVFSRLRVEGVLGFKWGEWIYKARTVETYIGSTVDGNIYGGLKSYK